MMSWYMSITIKTDLVFTHFVIIPQDSSIQKKKRGKKIARCDLNY